MSRGYQSNQDMDDEEITLESASIMTACLLQSTLTDDEMSYLLENGRDELDHLLDEEVLTERTVIKLDKKAVFNRNFMAALFTVAREKKDRDFKKLVTLWKMERILEDKITKKYGSEAKRRAAKMSKNASKSRSGTLNKASGRAMTPKSPPIKRIK